MNRQEIIRDIKKEKSSFLSITDIADYLQQSRESTRELMAGTEHLNAGRAKKYFVNDVADRILATRAVG